MPEPIFPDPDNEPLPPPVIHQIIKKPNVRPERKEITMFSIWTPVDKKETTEDADPPAEGEEHPSDGLPEMTKDQTRWVLGPKESRKLYVKFFTQNTGNFQQNLKFEIVGSQRSFDLPLSAVCEFPTVNSFYRNVFMTHKKNRPAK